MLIDDLLSRLDKVKSTGQEKWQACCPAHDDKDPSLSVASGDDDRILLRCWAGCTIEEITAALGLRVADLFPKSNLTIKERTEYAKKKSRAEIEAALLHELYVFVQIIGDRVADRELEKNINFRMLRPEWRPMPDGLWERELLAVKRIKNGLGRLYG